MALSSSQKDKLLDTKFKFRRILEITNAINENEKASELFKLFAEILGKDLKLNKAVFISQLNKEWKVAFQLNNEDFIISEAIIDELSVFTDIGNLSDAQNKSLRDFDILIPILHKTRPIGFLLLKDDEEETNKVSKLIKNLNYIQSTANIIMVAIENKRMAKAQLEQEGFKRELQLAEHIQKGLLPNNLPDNKSIASDAVHQSYGEVGGDYYDLIESAPNEYYFCIADISGKGISAALLMSNFQATFRASVNQRMPLTSLVRILNKSVLESSRGEKFITFFVARYDCSNKELEYLNCAHPSALLFNESRVRELRSSIPGLGMVDELPPFETESITLTGNSILTCYTDGITELENEHGELFGVQRLKESLRNFNKMTLDGLVEHVTSDLQEFATNSKVTDDIAALNILFKIN